MSQDSTQTIFQSAKRFLGGTLLSRFSGLLRDVAMAYAFGTEAAIAAFLVAFRFAHLLRRLFGEGALQTAFIPHFEELRKENPLLAVRFFRDLTASLSLFLIGVVSLAMFGLFLALTFWNLSVGNQEILFLTLLLMPSLLFICLFGLNASLLQCEKNFFTSGVAPVAFNLIWAIGVFSLWGLTADQAMPWLAVWVIAACFAQWVITVPQTHASLKRAGVSYPWQGIQLFSADVRRMIKPLSLGIIGVAASQVNNALDAVFARYASLEGPAYLWYALRIQQLPLALFGIAIAGALLPPLTRALKKGDMATYNHFLEFSIERTLMLMLPITAAIFVMGDTAIRLIYGRGDFSQVSVIETTRSLWGYGAGLVPMTLVLILAPAFYAKSNYRIPSLASLFAMILNLVCNAWWIIGLGLNTESVAWATSLSAVGNLIYLAVALPDRQALESRILWQTTGRVWVATLTAALVVVMVDALFLQGSTAWQILRGEYLLLPQTLMQNLMRFGIQFSTFVIVWLGFAWVLNIRLLSNLHLFAKIALFGIFFVKLFDHMFTYALKIFQKICSKIANCFKQSKF